MKRSGWGACWSSSCREESETLGLLALMLLIDARREARVGCRRRVRETGRSGSRALGIARGSRKARRCCACASRGISPGPYQLQAAINAVHSDARVAAETDWRQILTLYDRLMAIAPSAVVALNRAVAVAEVEGAEAALRIVEALELPNYQPYHAVRADLLRRAGRSADAAAAYQVAIEKCGNAREREFLEKQYRLIVKN